MADEDTQQPWSPFELVSDDDKPVNVLLSTSEPVGGVDYLPNCEIHYAKGHTLAAKEKPKKAKLKQTTLFPEAKPASSTSKHGHEPKADGASSSQELKAAKRIKLRDDERKTNDLMECFKARADGTTSAVLKDKSEASPTSNRREKLDEAFLLSKPK